MLADADYAGRAVEPPRMDASLRMVPSLVIAHLQKHVGRKQAYEMLVTAEPCQADAAFDAGLVNRLVPDGQVLTEALRWQTGSPSLSACARPSGCSWLLPRCPWTKQCALPANPAANAPHF
jgi:hypothetical protein